MYTDAPILSVSLPVPLAVAPVLFAHTSSSANYVDLIVGITGPDEIKIWWDQVNDLRTYIRYKGRAAAPSAPEGPSDSNPPPR